MEEKELRRLNRANLIEIIYEQRKNEEKLEEDKGVLQEKIEELKKQLQDRQQKVSKIGSLAEMSAAVSGLFDSAQETANHYLKEVIEMRRQAQRIRDNMEKEAAEVREKAMQEREDILRRTLDDCRQMRESTAGRRQTKEIQDPDVRAMLEAVLQDLENSSDGRNGSGGNEETDAAK